MSAVGSTGSSGAGLPKSTVKKLIQQQLPENVKCPQETAQFISECAEEFIHMLTAQAMEECTERGKKTLSGDDVMKALETLGYEAYLPEISRVTQATKPADRKPKRDFKHLSAEEEQHLIVEQQRLFELAKAAVKPDQ